MSSAVRFPTRAPDAIASRISAFQSDIPAQEAINRGFADLESEAVVDRIKYSMLQSMLERVQDKIESELQASDWTHGNSDSLQSKAGEASKEDKKPLSPEDEWTILQEEFLAYRHLTFMRYVFRHLRNLLGYVITAFILTVVSLSSYPFLGAHWLSLSAILVFLALGIGIVAVFAEMDRDAILSRITDTRANELGKNFLSRVARFGALPLVAVLAAQFPSVNRVFFSWVQPALEALR